VDQDVVVAIAALFCHAVRHRAPPSLSIARLLDADPQATYFNNLTAALRANGGSSQAKF